MRAGPEELADDDAARTCAATRAVRAPSEMIRFVRAPDGRVVPDIRRKLPGRGVWVTARRWAVTQAVRRKAFGRSFKAEVAVDPDLPMLVERLLAELAVQSLAMANKAGRVVSGFAKVESALRSGEAIAMLHAAEAAEDGKRKLAQLGHPPVAGIELFGSDQLSLALGRPHVIHAALLSGPVSAAFLDRCCALALYRDPLSVAAAGADIDERHELYPAKAEGMDAE